ncbi:von Willebrand factor [Macleaya cordata]|uniref:Midasin n=1 Tax=Macleaya cordata TaxID=56857 RepID=A0A200Q6N8_MACCD|nr:von Willebrand factor [Macleaya cordata]
MSIDGSFSLEPALRRFLDRCPNLKSIPRLKSLSEKGDKLTEEEVVNSISELFLNPNYTIPMMGCFRPIARKIVEKAVSLLRLVPSLLLNSDDTMMEIGEEENGQFIEVYVRSGKGLKLHELACLAFCRALDLAPFVLGTVLTYFKFAPPPFQRLLASDSASQLIVKDGAHLLDVVHASLRFLHIEPQIFSELWDWSSFLDLVQQSTNVDSINDPEFTKNVLDIRWCTAQILSIILKMSDRATEKFGLVAEEALACLFRWEDFCRDVSLEKAGWYLEGLELESGGSVDGNSDFSQEHCMQSFGLRSLTKCASGSYEMESLRRSRRPTTWDVELLDSPFVLTSAVKKSFEMVLLAVSQKWPILLYGPVSGGKTAMINKLAQVSGNRVLFIHMDEQMDGKTLIGSYICTEQPGEFRWQPGSLTQALLNGFWVVFEDFDKAPADVQCILLPLLEGASTFVTGRGEAISVADSFRLFATISSSKDDFSHNSEGRISLGGLWRRVMIGPSNNKDLLDIVNAWYPQLETVAEKIIETFERVNTASLHQIGGFQSFSRFSLSIPPFVFYGRDLLKWCKRIVGLGSSFVGLSLSIYECISIYQEATDIFAASSASSENRIMIMKDITKIWGVPMTEAETLYPLIKIIIQDKQSELQVGRVILKRTQAALHQQTRPFVDIRSSLHVLERIACSVKYNEPILLVGETGTGKTTLVQNLAMRLGQPLTVLNLSQQSDVADLLGGLKPTDPQFICIPLYNEFMELSSKTYSLKVLCFQKILLFIVEFTGLTCTLLFRIQANNVKGGFIDSLKNLRTEKNWKKLLKAFQKGLQTVLDYVRGVGTSGCGIKRKKHLGEDVLQAWEGFSVRLETARRQIDSSACMAFSFVEGAFITALRNGHWILLDEVNLAPPETLQRVLGVLEGERGSLCLAERGDVDYIDRHPDFRIFACMNPATDAGKRDLPYTLRSRFSEIFVDEVLDDGDLALFINQFMDESHRDLVSKIVRFYKAAKRESEVRLQDGANQKPQFSLRSLYRALEYTKKAQRKFGFQRALYDGFCMFFLTLLDGPSAKFMNNMILSHLLGGTTPSNVPFDGYLMNSSKSAELSKPDSFLENYVLTRTVKEHLRNLARAILIKRYPVLLQGPTSSGKTSLVHYLASITGHEFVRINNHEHTDLQEYLGSYVTDAYGKLVFQEGILVKAVRTGSWIVLDELNLAPSDVLEALNRLLDDNRELFVPELQETIQAHPDFMLFATQNPPTFYGGRKMLSRAFRNRFVEIHVDEIPDDELTTILERRCEIPQSYAIKMVEVMKDLQLHRQSSKVFAGKHGFITPRDLFRWADRFRIFGKSYEDLAKDGYFLLAERLRDESEKNVVREVLEKRLRVKLVKDFLYTQEAARGHSFVNPCNYSGVSEHLGSITWTKSMQRLYFLVERCYKMREPVLLVGETGGGKTTVCQLLSIALKSKLHILNCHQYTETSDFLGGFYPVRDRSKLMKEFKSLVEQLMISNVFLCLPGSMQISSDIGGASSSLNQLSLIINTYRKGEVSHPDVSEKDIDNFEQITLDLVQLHRKWQTIFTWQDGPLVQAMKDGDLFLVDEISLADDSVLERLNSVLETERKLSLAEKGGPVLERITAHPNFFLLATMNPGGGDYGKKELSPALRNRFTEIWVTSVSDPNELQSIAVQRFLKPAISYTVDPMISFWEWFNQLQTGRLLTVRDLLSWVDFINVAEGILGSNYAFLHGAFLVLLDGLSLGTSISRHYAEELREKSLSFLVDSLKLRDTSSGDSQIPKMENFGWGELGKTLNIMTSNNVQSNHRFGINSFYITKGEKDCKPEGFEFLAPTTCRNALRVLRAMQLAKPVLLEGSPGVGKTSLIVALGKYSGHSVVRINLSEQTDMMDLLGSDLPIEDEEGMKFAWSDGILLQALKNGDWVLLDELNLAPQSVLEGLNAILDHRAEVFIPELGCTFKCPPSFRVFACQNPSSQGGGRKGLPKSFLNRFTKVYVDELVEDDYLYICSSLHPSIPRSLLSKLICFNKRVYEDTMLFHKYGQDGSPWEFNLRDVTRSCQIMEGSPEKSKMDSFLNVVYIQRMRTAADRREVIKLYEAVFGVKTFLNPYPRVQINPRYLIVGNSAIERNHFQPSRVSKSELSILPGIRYSLEAAMHCVQRQWLCILVGPSSSGKTSLVRLLSQLTGNVLNELNLSSATDSSELLGCFEQYNAFRNFRSALAQVEKYIDEYCSLSLESAIEALIIERKSLVSRWSSFLSSINCNPMSTSVSAYAEGWKSAPCSSLGSLVHIIEQLRLGLENYHLPVSWSGKDLNKTLKTILDLQENNKKHSFSAKFEWVTGLLIKAIECGEWIVLENANLCNPTVLDRINSLVEPSGTITVNECGLVDGRPVVLHPHQKFRLFLTVNPRYGEISRAMRNRGVEIFMMQPYWIYDGENGYTLKENEIRDVKRFLVQAGIPTRKFVDAMAEAHLFARDTGLSLGVQITLLELTRWVQLFVQLLMNGNMPLWSLQLSWDHTYLSSLGDAEGKDAIEHAKVSYLSRSTLSELDTLLGCSLPGGWPSPIKLRDFIAYSREASIKQNCMYLEFLGAQFASYELSQNRTLINQAGSFRGSGHTQTYLRVVNKLNPSVIPLRMLQHVLFPSTSDKLNFRGDTMKFDLALTNKMLFYAANWLVEQASESDLKLYLFWLSWYNSQLEPHCLFFKSFLGILEQELSHPIWNCIFDCQRNLTSFYQIDVDKQHLPLLSLKLVDLTAPNEALQMVSRRLYNAILCVRLLRLSLGQWSVEDEHDFGGESHGFIPLLECLRELEKEVLNKLVDYPHFDDLIQLYTDLLEDHTSFWNGITSSRLECLVLSLRSLKKDVLKLQGVFPKAVGTLLVEFRNLVKVSPWKFNFPKSVLWVHGGHPLLPSSADIYAKVRQLLHVCELIWPMRTKTWKQASSGNHYLMEVIVSADKELRSLAMQGVCMSSYLTTKWDQDDVHIVQQLDEMHQMLMGRFEFEKRKMETVLLPKVRTSLMGSWAGCCVFCPELLCSEPIFNSWRETLPLCDGTSFSLDTELLQKLSNIILVDAEELFPALSNTSEHLRYALNFSLEFSSRPPTDFVPHQTILWTLDAWESVDLVKRKVATYILEMWFKWHSYLWTYCPEPVRNFAKIDDCDAPLPYMLFLPAKIATLDHILQGAFIIKDYAVHCLKLRVASRNIWQDSPSGKDAPSFLLSAAQSLFQQIIYAHGKSFEHDKYEGIKSIFCSIQGNQVKQGDLQALGELIASSSHFRLTSLVDMFIKPLLGELYIHHSFHDLLSNLGRAWLHIGGLRFHLLLSPGDLDPAIKYSFKHSQLMEKISLLGLEIKVRQECDHLAGRSSTKDDEKSAVSLESLEEEARKLKRKVVFRDDPAKFTKLKSECADFLKSVTSAFLTKNLEGVNTLQMINQVCNWQETAASFVNRLSDEYASYVDIIQPIQVAVYEMKLGLSLVVSSTLQKAFLDKVEEDNMNHVLQTIYSFMQFPRNCAAISISTGVNSRGPDYLSSYQDVFANTSPTDVHLLKKLVGIKKEVSSDKVVSVLQLHAALYHNILVRKVHDAVNSLLMDNMCFELLSEIFNEFSMLWMSMKVQTKAKEDDAAQNYRFKTREFKIEDILEVDVSSLRNSFADQNLCLEWQELLAEEELKEWAPPKEHENLEEEWNLIQDSVLKNMVYVHNQLFGSSNLVESPGIVQISDAEKLSCFLDSYKLGMVMIKDLKGIIASSLDAKLMPEHFLHVCLEFEEKFGSSRSALAYNFYKDSNAPAMAGMVEPLRTLQQRVTFLLNEWPDHPGLQKILDVTEMLLAIPLSTPLAKALSGLQFLLSKGQMLEEHAPKFSLSDQLQPIRTLASSWQKMELESWPALLDGVQEQYESNAGKLWFPLYSVLHRGQPADSSGDSLSTIQSLEEFIQTSSIGEFKKRLQLLLAFHGQIDSSVRLKSDPSPSLMENLKILYNVFGYYIQFLSLVTEHIESHRRNIVVELKDHLKLCRWERPETYLSIESSKRTRQKLRKIIQKFNDLLQQPVMVIINQDAAKKGIKVPSMLGPKSSNAISDMSAGIVLSVSVDVTLFSYEERPIWYNDWRKKVDSALQNLSPEKIPEFKDAEEIGSIVSQYINSESSCLIYQEQSKNLWLSLENICRTATECADLWKDETKSFGKRRALSDFLKLLENCGLSRHKSMDELKSSQPSSWFLQPSYHVKHLLLPQSGQLALNVGITSDAQCQKLLNVCSNSNWEIANKYYYKSVSMVQLLRQICLNFHKDFSLEQIVRSSSFLDHLILIQQEQRFVAYGFADQMNRLRKCTASLNDIHTNPSNVDDGASRECCLTLNQHATYKCMWQQKHLFDSLYAISHEASLLLRKVENSHLNTCQSVKVESNKILVFIEKFMSNLKKSKESLDRYLLGDNRIVTTPAACSPPFVVSQQMEQLVMQNFKEINEFEEHIKVFNEQNIDRKSVKETLLGRFGDILNKGKEIMEEFHSSLETKNQLMSASENGGFLETFTNLEVAFAESVKETFKQIIEAFQKLGSGSSGCTLSEDSSSGNITLWKVLFESCLLDLQLDLICEKLNKTIKLGVDLIDNAGHSSPSLCLQVQRHLKHLHVLIDLLLTFGDGVLLEFLAMHRTVAEMTHMLANVFASLYSKGFGSPPGEDVDDTGGDKSQDATGTGMGEGAGLNDVSEQINDEDQLLGSSEKPDEGPDATNEVPSKNDKGIEMDQDFAADTFSVSEDSGDDENEDSDEEKLDSAMGKTGDDGEVADENLGDKDDESNTENKNEKYETGPSVKDADLSSKELRAKEDDVTTLDESEEMNADNTDKQKNDDDGGNIPDDDENMEGMMMDKDEAYADPTGIELDEKQNQGEDDTNVEEHEISDTMEETSPEEENNENGENGNDEDGKANPVNEEDMDAESEEVGKNVETDDQGMDHDHDENAESDLVAPDKPSFEQGMPDFTRDHVPNAESAARINGDAQASDSSMVAPEEQWANNSNMQNGLAPSRGLPSSSVPQIEITVPDSSEGGKLTDDQPNAQSQEHENDTSSMQRTNPNPYRSVGDALEKWKERVKVSVDSEENGKEGSDDMEDENAEEYGFVSEFEKGTSQALGPATSDQMDKNIKGNEPEGGEDHTKEKQNITEMEVEKQDPETQPVKNYSASTFKQKTDERMEKSNLNNEVTAEEGSPIGDYDDDRGNMSGDLVSINRSYMGENILQISKLRVDDDEDLGKSKTLEEVSGDMKENATTLWRKYELSTTRLSQELAEQLRLVMEPTVASKLQGDYKTGKRINMKKVIPYIASHYRKDKIWLRRTRPNKRDYQVIVAVDDSRSMSESKCGNVAIEALVTVCRAMSQLEVGQLAVASFGKKGNIRLLHDFNQPFTGETGMQMISSLTFKQENTIADEPVVDLLKYLNNKLDAAVANSRLPSGQNPLQQLILIIADGRFHEKEKLKRCVRDVLNKKRMVAFLLIDSPQESIIDFMEASFMGEKVTFTKYLNSFPFPYYIVLKNMEALPRTLADLLRQWFELMQNMRD